jgi:hypothetical protein
VTPRWRTRLAQIVALLALLLPGMKLARLEIQPGEV